MSTRSDTDPTKNNIDLTNHKSAKAYEPDPITLKDLRKKTQKVRDQLNNVLWREIAQPRSLDNMESMQCLADVLRAVLDLFVGEHKIDFKLIFATLESCQQVSVRRDKANKRAKMSLA